MYYIYVYTCVYIMKQIKFGTNLPLRLAALPSELLRGVTLCVALRGIGKDWRNSNKMVQRLQLWPSRVVNWMVTPVKKVSCISLECFNAVITAKG